MDGLALSIGDTFTPNPIVLPKYIKTSHTLDSDNEAVAEIVGNTIVAKENGSATVTATAKSFGNVFTDSATVTVKDLEYGLSSARTPTGIVLTRVPETIEVGEDFSTQAYILSAMTDDHPYPYGFSDDNLVKFTSNNEAVCRVKNGVLMGISPGTATITASDVSGTVSETFTVQVVEESRLEYTEAEVMEVNPNNYDWTDAETTTLAIQAILDEASAAGMKKVIFPNQIYTVSPAYGSIYIPTRMIVDFSGAVIQIEESALTQTGYVMIYLQNTEYSSIENAVIYGERYLIDGTGNEHCVSVKICGTSVKSGLNNCTCSNSPGFNIAFGNTSRKVAGVQYKGIVTGGLDANGNEKEESYAFRSDYTKISGVENTRGQIWLGNVQGYGGYLYLSARVYSLYFYDANKTFLSMIPNCIQYYAYQKPENAVYARIVFWQGSAPTSYDPDFSSVAHFHSYDKPYRCYIKNCILENNYSLAISTQGGESMLIDGCKFKNNGYRDPHSHIDWEDGRQHNKGHILRNCTFEGGGIAVCVIGSDGLVAHNNVLKDTSMDVRDEVQNSRIWLNQFIRSRATITTKTDMVFSQNLFWDGAAFEVTVLDGVSFGVRQAGNIVEK